MSESESQLRALCDDILNGKRFAFGVFITYARGAERECIFILIVSIFGLAVACASETGRCGANVAD